MSSALEIYNIYAKLRLNSIKYNVFKNKRNPLQVTEYHGHYEQAKNNRRWSSVAETCKGTSTLLKHF
jgi:hypothetical protein